VLCPCHFICRVQLEKDGRGWRLDAEGLERFKAMKRYISARARSPQAADAAIPSWTATASHHSSPSAAPQAQDTGPQNVREDIRVQEDERPESTEQETAPVKKQVSLEPGSASCSEDMAKLPSPARAGRTP
jgi:hypothetical protein